MCKEAVEYNSCIRRYCKFYHPRGTNSRDSPRREKPNVPSTKNNKVNEGEAENGHRTVTEPVNPKDSFLEALKDLKCAINMIKQQVSHQNQTINQIGQNAMRMWHPMVQSQLCTNMQDRQL